MSISLRTNLLVLQFHHPLTLALCLQRSEIHELESTLAYLTSIVHNRGGPRSRLALRLENIRPNLHRIQSEFEATVEVGRISITRRRGVRHDDRTRQRSPFELALSIFDESLLSLNNAIIDFIHGDDAFNARYLYDLRHHLMHMKADPLSKYLGKFSP